jgi:hypothetical protein
MGGAYAQPRGNAGEVNLEFCHPHFKKVRLGFGSMMAMFKLTNPESCALL